MATHTKLGAMAANSLREKRMVRSGSNTNINRLNDESMEAAAEEILEVSMVSEAASSTSTGRSNVYSFFDPQEIHKPGSPPAAPQSPKPFDERGIDNNDTAIAAGTGNNDDSSSISHGSVATERIANRRSISNSSSVGVISSANSDSGGAVAVMGASVRPTWDQELETREVKYEDGATDLFMLIEDAKWEGVCDRVEEEPSEARTWVVSSGTENTVFSWSVWRRLPLHEACRRQPPPQVIYALLAAYPESSMAESNFGELPLHAAVRCGACAEVVNCIIASYPAAALARDNSGCTPLDILNGTGIMTTVMDHDGVVAALNRTIAVLTREEHSWGRKISSMQQEFKQSKDKRRKEYERIVANKNAEIEDLKRTLEQEKLATSNLASKVIQTEQVVQDKGKLEKRYQEKLKKMEQEINELKNSNATRKDNIKGLESIVCSDRQTIVELNNRVQTLQTSFTSLLEDEETFVSTKLSRAEKNFKTLMESQFVFLRETERRKDLLRGRVKQLGINIPPKKKAEDEGEKKKAAQKKKAEIEDDVSNNEVAEKALASAMAHLNQHSESSDESD